MRNRFFSILLLICVFGIALVMISCVPEGFTFNDYKAIGGGWFTYEPEDGFPTSKVTFGFRVDCTENIDDDYLGTGQIQYNDHGMGVKFHGVVEALNCYSDPESPQRAIYAGMVKPQSSREMLYDGDWYKPAYFAIMITDGGTPGPSNGDFINIELYIEKEVDEELDYILIYEAGGTIKGGNIKIFLGE